MTMRCHFRSGCREAWSALLAFAGLALAPGPLSGQPFVYVSDNFLDRVLVVDPATDSLVTSISVGDQPEGLAVTPDGGRVLVANRDSGTVSVIDTASQTVVATIPVGVFPHDVAILPGGSRAYVTNQLSDSVSVIDMSSLSVVATVAVGAGPLGIAASADGTRVWVVERIANSVSAIDPATHAVVSTIPVSNALLDVAIAPDGGTLYLSRAVASGLVMVVDVATASVVAAVALPAVPDGIAVAPDGSRVWVARSGDGGVSVLDPATLSLTADLSLPGSAVASGVAPTAEGDRIYVAAGSDGRVWWIDAAAEAVLGFLVTGGNPFRVATGPPEVIVVEIDVKPGSFPNCFNLNGHGVIPVAVLGSAELEVTEIDPQSLLFDGLRVRVRGKRGPLCSFEEVDGDGFLDLVCQFEDEPENWSAGSDTATLTGALFDGRRIEGQDSICTVG